MLTKNDIPAEWQDVLASLQSKFPKVVIAGGALRDLDHSINVKDLDIFIEAGDMDEAQGLNDLLGGTKMEDQDPDVQFYPDSMSELILVTDLKVDLKIPVQLIFCNWRVKDIWNRFDYGLCRIMFDGQEVKASPDYDAGKDVKEFRLLRCDNERALAASIRRFARWAPRYPDYRWNLGCRLEMGSTPTHLF